MTKKQDIQTRIDIELLIRAFYDKVLVDKTIGFIFTEVVPLDLEHHFPKLFDFWENTLLKPNGYKTNVLQVHLDLNKKVKLKPEHFERWLQLFVETVDELFEGKTANMAKNRAFSIAVVMQSKLIEN